MKYFYEFYKKSINMKKGIKNNRRKKNNFLNETIKRYKPMKDLEKKFYDKEEQMCTFSPKINKNKFFFRNCKC